jgi:hypothetical protein
MRQIGKAIVLIASSVLLMAAQGTYQPKFKGDPAKSEAEAQALGYMRTVNRAQAQYKRKREKYAQSLMELAGHGSLTKRMARATDRGDYTVHFRSTKDGYTLALNPKQFAPDHRAFYSEEDGKIRVEEDKAAGPDSPPLK